MILKLISKQVVTLFLGVSVAIGDEPTPDFCLKNIQRRNLSANASAWVEGMGSGILYTSGVASAYTTVALSYDQFSQGRTTEGLIATIVGSFVTSFLFIEGNQFVSDVKTNQKRVQETGSMLDLASYLGLIASDDKIDIGRGKLLFQDITRFVTSHDPRITVEEIRASLKAQYFKYNCGYFFKKNFVLQANEYYMSNSPLEIGGAILSEKSIEYFKEQTRIEEAQRETGKKIEAETSIKSAAPTQAKEQ